MKNSQDGKHVRQNDAYKASRKHEANLRRNPTLHFQVGLILALLVSIFFLEVRMPTQALKAPSLDYDEEEAVWDEQFQIETKVVEVPKEVVEEPKQPEPQIPEEVQQVDDDTQFKETVLKGTSEPDPNASLVDPNSVAYEDPAEEPADVPFISIEEVPLFPGCEGLSSNAERRDCMSSKINKFVNKKFDTDLGEELGLTGVNRIFVQFKVDKSGAITDIKSRGPHDKLEEEAARVINLLPQMQPGKQQSQPVGVIYSLPITFRVQD